MKLTIISFLIFFTYNSFSKIELSSLFQDKMILQSNSEVSIWGKAKPNEKISISFNGLKKTTRVNKKGMWFFSLPPMRSNKKNQNLILKTKYDQKIIKEVLIGEVWLCSGQSNMEFTFTQMITDALSPENQPLVKLMRKEVNESNDPLLRMITVPHNKTSRFKELDNFQGKWQKTINKNVLTFSTTAYYFAKELRKKLKVPIGIICSSRGATYIESWIPREGFKSNPELKTFYQKNSSAADNRDFPGTLFNAMIAPLIPYTFKGIIWYQGEQNMWRDSDKYGERFKTLITSWRIRWKNNKLPFIFAQLAGFGDLKSNITAANNWIRVTYEQIKGLELPYTSMVVLNDIGSKKDIHPKNKFDVGKRFALSALKNVYNVKNVIASGPRYSSHLIKKNKVHITFKDVGERLLVGKKVLLDFVKTPQSKLNGFEIKGKNSKWLKANAKIRNKDTVEISHPEIKDPINTRYAWSAFPEEANLYNSEGLPTSLFIISSKEL